MNYSIVFYIIGWILNFEAAFMALPTAVALIYHESEVWCFLATMAVCLMVGMLLVRRKPKNQIFYVAESFVAVSLSWVLLSVMGAAPFVLSGYIPNPIDALFETVSGFTTTGASILSSVEQLPNCLLFWRSFTHWIGGMGVLVFLLSFLPMVGGSHMNLMKAESPGPIVSRLVPKVQMTAKLLYQIYLGMTILEAVILILGKMPIFDAITITVGTAGTGGFAIRNDSLASYTAFQKNVVTVFMILFGVNFNFYFFLLMRKIGQAFKMQEVRAYFLIIASAVGIITVNTVSLCGNALQAFQDAAFQVGSVITTTGYATVDFDKWPEFSKCIIVLLMFIGACAGSTGGGMKVSRIMIAFKEAKREISTMIHPRSVKVLKYEGKVIGNDTLRVLNCYIIVYFMLFVASVLIVSLDNYDFTTSFTAVAANFNNIGPGLSVVGPASNFSMMSYLSKSVLIFDMLAGRLELFPVLVLLSPGTWKRG